MVKLLRVQRMCDWKKTVISRNGNKIQVMGKVGENGKQFAIYTEDNTRYKRQQTYK